MQLHSLHKTELKNRRIKLHWSFNMRLQCWTVCLENLSYCVYQENFYSIFVCISWLQCKLIWYKIPEFFTTQWFIFNKASYVLYWWYASRKKHIGRRCTVFNTKRHQLSLTTMNKEITFYKRNQYCFSLSIPHPHIQNTR